MSADDSRKKWIATLAYWRERASWTDAQFLAEICADKRREAKCQVQALDEAIEAERAYAEYVKRYGPD